MSKMLDTVRESSAVKFRSSNQFLDDNHEKKDSPSASVPASKSEVELLPTTFNNLKKDSHVTPRVSSSAPSQELLSNQERGMKVGLAGILQPLLEDDSIEEIWINSPNRIFIARNGRTELVPFSMSAQEIRDAIERMLAWSGRRVDLSQPFVDARLPNGARLHVVIPDITAEYWTLNIRKRALKAFTLEDLVEAQSINTSIAQLLREIVLSRSNILVSGATQAGKTTILNCLLGELPVSSRLISIEEVFELVPQVADHVALQTRQANLEGQGEVTLRMLVREALRMRPTHLVIGEVRGAEALDLLLALNSGIPGLASIHANSPVDALRKITALPLLAGTNINRDFTIEAVQENFDIVIHCEKYQDGTRRVSQIAIVTKSGDRNSIKVESLIEWNSGVYKLGEIDFDTYPKLRNIKEMIYSQTFRDLNFNKFAAPRDI